VTTVVLLIDRRDLSVWQVLAPAGTALAYATSLYDWTGHFFATYDYFNYHLVALGRGAVLPAVAVRAALGLPPPPSPVHGITVVLIGITLALNLYLGLSRAVRFDPHEYVGSDTNALPILVGCLLAIVVDNGWLSRTLRCLRPGRCWPSPPARPGLPGRHLPHVPGAGRGHRVTLVIVIGVVTRPRSPAGSLLATGPMRWLGERSYSIYLWNVLAAHRDPPCARAHGRR
jgi:peptidoglycan/LPS O-acetylase OafA/YrhL